MLHISAVPRTSLIFVCLSILYLRCSRYACMQRRSHCVWNHLSILYLRCFNDRIDILDGVIPWHLSILYLRCWNQMHHSPRYGLIYSFNSLFEMPGLCRLRMSCTQRRRFQFSIWDAAQPCGRWPVGPTGFQFSIWDAVVVTSVTSTWYILSILYLRCGAVSARGRGPRAVVRRNLSILYLRCLVMLDSYIPYGKSCGFQFSIWDAVEFGRKRY